MYLCVDFGSTSFKAAAFDANGERRGEASRDLTYLSNDIRVELAEEEVFDATKSVMGEAARNAGVKPANVRAVGVTSQAQTLAIIGRDGRFKTPFVSWLDKRAAKAAADAAADTRLRDYARHFSAASISPGLSLSILRHLLWEEPIGWQSTDSVLPLPSYPIWKLTGKNVLDENLASMNGLYSLMEKDWWGPSLDFLGISRNNLPKLSALGAPAAMTTSEGARPFGMPAGIPVFSAGNDQTAGAYGAGVHLNGATLVTLGTAQVAYVSADRLPGPVSPTEGFYMRGPYPGGRFYRLGVTNLGGGLITIAIRDNPELKDFPTFFSLAEEAGPDDGSCRLEVDTANNAVGWVGATPSPALKARLVLDHLVDAMADLLKGLGTLESGKPMLCAGGGARNAIWRRLLEEKTGARLTRVEVDPAHGAALLLRDYFAAQKR